MKKNANPRTHTRTRQYKIYLRRGQMKMILDILVLLTFDSASKTPAVISSTAFSVISQIIEMNNITSALKLRDKSLYQYH